MNKKRQAIYDKSGGVCWYCGCTLVKGWHVDHFHPIIRRDISWLSEQSKKAFNAKSCEFPERDNEQNKVPSCPSCNLQKSQMDIEQFRVSIERFITSLNRYTNQYKIAKRYGLINETKIDVKFWYEMNNNEVIT